MSLSTRYSIATPKMVVPAYDEAFTPYLEKGHYQRQILMLGLSYVTNWARAIDVGAHIGFMSRDMAWFFRDVEAFEPHPHNYDCLEKNTADNVHIHKHALGAETHRAGMYAPILSNSGSWEICEGDVIDVKPLDEYGFDEVGLIKIDVQGHEMEVLKGAKETLERNRPVVILEISKAAREDVKNQKFCDTIRYLVKMGAVAETMVKQDVVLRWPE